MEHEVHISDVQKKGESYKRRENRLKVTFLLRNTVVKILSRFVTRMCRRRSTNFEYNSMPQFSIGELKLYLAADLFIKFFFGCAAEATGRSRWPGSNSFMSESWYVCLPACPCLYVCCLLPRPALPTRHSDTERY